jgi:hypothetical protein
LNNPPQVTQGQYEVPSSCTTSSPDNECFFGQYYTFEDSPIIVSLGGVNVDDPDLYELCDYTSPQCKSIDITVRAEFGSVALNTRSNLVIYITGRNQQSFLAALSWAKLAVKVIDYEITLPADTTNGVVSCTSGDALCAAARQFNTQRGGKKEYVYVTASDQVCSQILS